MCGVGLHACSVSCGGPGVAAPASDTVDCVRVLGAPPPSARMPLDGVPFSGVDRTKRIADLSDQELAALCDFDVCTRTNGYGRTCAENGQAGFELQTAEVIADAVQTCVPAAPSQKQTSYESRASCIEIYRQYYRACHVGSWEDCLREIASDPLGASAWGPDCKTTEQECPVM